MLSILAWAVSIIAALFVTGSFIGGSSGKTVQEMRARKDASHNRNYMWE